MVSSSHARQLMRMVLEGDKGREQVLKEVSDPRRQVAELQMADQPYSQTRNDLHPTGNTCKNE